MKALKSCAGAAALLAALPAGAEAPVLVHPVQRIAAATATAQGSNACAAIQPFYWEIGNRNGALVSGSVDPASSATPAVTAATSMNIASASKWLYAAYVVQKRNGELSHDDIEFLNLRSGYVHFSTCLPRQTVDRCLNTLNNSDWLPAEDGIFHYGGGHMQKHASLMGLGALDNAALAAELQTQLGPDVGLGFSLPQPAGGVVSTAGDYARFLRKLLDGRLRMGNLLGSHAVCTNPTVCEQASHTPTPSTEQWQYSLGHWVESDPHVGDGAFSSAGALGFYPWVDASRRWYGVLARRDDQGSAHESVQCGRLIRKAWVTGTAQ
jgi:Beta-lactamase